MSDNLHVSRDGGGAVLTVTFNRPAQHNAITLDMYSELIAACDAADGDPAVKAMVLRGAGGKSFASGTDISVFSDFSSGQQGVEYEKILTRAVNRVEDVGKPTIAAIDGYCLGGGLALASVCDLRIATRTSRFGMPIAKTLANCLSMNSISILVGHLGPARTLDIVLRAKMLPAADAHAAGYVAELCDAAELDATVESVTDTLLAHAPLTIWATKTAITRLRRSRLPDDDDIISRVYGSDDFRKAVAAFTRK